MASSINQLGASPIVFDVPEVAEVIEIRETIPNQNKKIIIQRTITVEEYVRNYFSDIPVMAEVARCESGFRQHDKSGNILSGIENSSDKGVMQVNEYYHKELSEKLGYDITTIEGNTAYARFLFEKQGLRPWKSSSPCWSKSTAYSKYKELAVR